MPGAQWGDGAMGNARWTGVSLRDLLELAGLKAKAKQVTFDGLDEGPLPSVPDFVKALDVQHALDGDVLIAYEMNGKPLPMLNGFPARFVVPGWYATYWVKALTTILVLPHEFTGFWMAKAYKIPANADASESPAELAKDTVSINRMNVRSFFVRPEPEEEVPAGRAYPLEGIAFDGGHGIKLAEFSPDGGATWTQADSADLTAAGLVQGELWESPAPWMDSVRASRAYWLFRSCAAIPLLAGFAALALSMLTGSLGEVSSLSVCDASQKRHETATLRRSVIETATLRRSVANRQLRWLQNAYLLTSIAGLGFFLLSFLVLAVWPNRSLEQQIAQTRPPQLAPLGARELSGRKIYGREGCVNCHSQFVRFTHADVAIPRTRGPAVLFSMDMPPSERERNVLSGKRRMLVRYVRSLYDEERASQE